MREQGEGKGKGEWEAAYLSSRRRGTGGGGEGEEREAHIQRATKLPRNIDRFPCCQKLVDVLNKKRDSTPESFQTTPIHHHEAGRREVKLN